MEEDPSHDRVVTEILPPPMFNLPHNKLFPTPSLPDWLTLKTHLTQEGKLDKEDIIQLITIFKNIVTKESNIVKTTDPVSIVGDIHGQFYDLIKVLEKGGDPSKTNYLFLGDYVDRGLFSIECVLLLMALKINYKNNITMLRGNHECRQLTSFFNFKQECEVKYDFDIYERFMEAFDALPLACIINDKFLAVHGGISPSLSDIAELNKLNRFAESPKDGAMCDLIWADPCDKDDVALTLEWQENKTRGCSFVFGAKATTPFLKNNNLLTIVRGHEAQLEGYKISKWNSSTVFPSVITIFSAPNYCDVYNNKGALLKLIDNKINIQQYNFSPHPFILPNFMNVFSWSIPFVSEKIGEMLIHIIKKDPDLEGDNDTQLIDKTINNSLKLKVKFLTMLMKMYRTIREENELIMKLKGFCPGNKIPKGILLEGPEAIKSVLDRYEMAKEMDKLNEKMPGS